MNIDLSVSIVNYNTGDLVLQCIQSIISSTVGLTYEIIVVDNASTDGSVESIRQKFPQVKLISNRGNRFFTIANNQGVRESRGKYILILGPDTVIRKNSLKLMYDFMEKNPKAGAVNCKIVFPDGSLSWDALQDYGLVLAFLNYTFLGKIFAAHKKHLNRKYNYFEINKEMIQQVDTIGDFCLLIRKKTIEEIGNYDERFKLYYTENDICKRMRIQGWKIFHIPDGEVVHFVQQSVIKEGARKISKIYSEDTIKYYRKYYGWLAAICLMFLIKITNIGISLIKLKYRNIFYLFLRGPEA